MKSPFSLGVDTHTRQGDAMRQRVQMMEEKRLICDSYRKPAWVVQPYILFQLLSPFLSVFPLWVVFSCGHSVFFHFDGQSSHDLTNSWISNHTDICRCEMDF